MLKKGSLIYHPLSINILLKIPSSGLLPRISSSIITRENIIKEHISTSNHVENHISTRSHMGELYIYNPISINRISKHRREHVSTLRSHLGAQSQPETTYGYLNPSYCVLIFPSMTLNSHVVEHPHHKRIGFYNPSTLSTRWLNEDLYS